MVTSDESLTKKQKVQIDKPEQGIKTTVKFLDLATALSGTQKPCADSLQKSFVSAKIAACTTGAQYLSCITLGPLSWASTKAKC